MTYQKENNNITELRGVIIKGEKPAWIVIDNAANLYLVIILTKYAIHCS